MSDRHRKSDDAAMRSPSPLSPVNSGHRLALRDLHEGNAEHLPPIRGAGRATSAGYKKKPTWWEIPESRKEFLEGLENYRMARDGLSYVIPVNDMKSHCAPKSVASSTAVTQYARRPPHFLRHLSPEVERQVMHKEQEQRRNKEEQHYQQQHQHRQQLQQQLQQQQQHQQQQQQQQQQERDQKENNEGSRRNQSNGRNKSASASRRRQQQQQQGGHDISKPKEGRVKKRHPHHCQRLAMKTPSTPALTPLPNSLIPLTPIPTNPIPLERRSSHMLCGNNTPTPWHGKGPPSYRKD